MRDSIISMSFFSVVLSVQHLFSSLGDYSHGWVCVCVWLPQQLRVQMYRDQQTDNTQRLCLLLRYQRFCSSPHFPKPVHDFSRTTNLASK